MFTMTIIYIYSKLRIYINPFVGLLTGCQITPATGRALEDGGGGVSNLLESWGWRMLITGTVD